MTHPPPRLGDIQRTIAECATDIVADFERQQIPVAVSIAITARIVGLLVNHLPTDQRAPFLRAYAADLLRTPRLDA